MELRMTTEMVTTVYAGVGVGERGIESPASPLEPDDWSKPHDNSIDVTPETAIYVAAVWQAVLVLSGDVAQLPAKVFKRMATGGREPDRAHPAWRLMHRRPSKYLSPFQFKQLMMFWALLRGNAYAYIAKKGGIPVELRPFAPGEIVPEMVNGELKYRHLGPNGSDLLDSSEVFHVRGPGGDILAGQSVIAVAAGSLSVGMQAQRYINAFLENDATPRLAIHFPDPLSETAIKNYLRHFEQRHAGPSKAGKPAILDRGGKIEQFSINNADAKIVELRQQAKQDVASWFNLQPHKVGDLSRATFSNIEQQSIDYVTYSLSPWLIRWQDECNAKLFTEQEIDADSHYCEFSVNALLRGDAKSRSEFYNTGIMAGWMTRNEARQFENMNEIEGLSEPLQPLNMATPGEEPPEEELPADPVADDDDDLRSLYGDLLGLAVERAHRRVVSAAARSAGTAGALQAFIDGDLERQRGVAQEALALTVEKGRAMGLIDLEARCVADRVVDSLRGVLLRELDKPAKGLKERVNGYAATPLVDAASLLGERNGTAIH
jgi:HK97 family phage portal protein